MKFSSKYRVAPWKLSDSELQRQLFLRVADEAPNVLTVHGLPSYVTEAGVRSLFGRFGAIEAIALGVGAAQTSAKGALVTLTGPGRTDVRFSSVAEAEAALGEEDGKREALLLDADTLQPLGLKRWEAELRSAARPAKELIAEAEAAVADYDQRERREKEAEAAEGEPDDDGWTTVSYKKAPGDARKRKAPAESKAKAKDSAKRKRGEDRADAFLHLTTKEEKAQRQAELVAKFEEDRKKIKSLAAKANRPGFNPV